jgi:acetyl-CoA C-acetyltransferase
VKQPKPRVTRTRSLSVAPYCESRSAATFGLGPVPAVRLALECAGWQKTDIERIAINVAFAAAPLAVLKELGLPEDIAIVEGGGIAYGHAIGATGSVLATRLMRAMRRDGIR